MSHMVIYRGSDGKPGYHQTDDIHDAVGFVERMRNEEGVEQARIFRLEEVVFEYRPYYRVELSSLPALEDGVEQGSLSAGADASNSESNLLAGEASVKEVSDSEDSNVSEIAVDQPAEASEPEPIGAAKRGLFGR